MFDWSEGYHHLNYCLEHIEYLIKNCDRHYSAKENKVM